MADAQSYLIDTEDTFAASDSAAAKVDNNDFVDSHFFKTDANESVVTEVPLLESAVPLRRRHSRQPLESAAPPRKTSFKIPDSKNSSSSNSNNCNTPTYSSSLADFFLFELNRGWTPEQAQERFSEKQKTVNAFIKIPRELEKFLFYGFLQCTDAFLYMYTFLPLRFIVAVWRSLTYPWHRKPLSTAQQCDLLKVFILFVASLIMMFVDISVMYHLVRGQGVIKLYIFFNMLEVADKLFSSFGQDILDALFYSLSNRKRPGLTKLPSLGVISQLAIAIVYVVLHAILVLSQATTLNVAFNSHNKALLTIMMSNNFTELKGSVFKKFARNNLFQMSCSDVRERFHYCILLSVVVLRNMGEFSWKIDHFWEMVPDLVLVLIAEVLVDWTKHCFIGKFNEIPFEVYKDFTVTIAYDVANSRRATAFSDHCDQVSRRMGFIPLPLTVLLLRILLQTVHLSCWPAVIICFFAYLSLLVLKVLNSIILLGKACGYIQEYESMQKHAEQLRRLCEKRSKSLPGSPRLSLIDFSDLMQQNHPTHGGYTLTDLLMHASELAALQRNTFDDEVNDSAFMSPSGTISGRRQTVNITRSKSEADMNPSKLAEDRKSKDSSKENLQGRDSPCKHYSGSTSHHDDEKKANNTPGDKKSDMESLATVDRFTLCNDDRIVL